MDEPASRALIAAVLGAAALSVAVLFRLFQRHIDGQPLLPLEPRGVPPWNLFAPLLMLAPLMISVGNAALAPEPVNPLGEIVALQSATQAASAGSNPAAAFGASAAAAASTAAYSALADAAAMPWVLVQSAALSILLSVACYALLALVFGATPHDLGLPETPRQLAQDIWIGAGAFAASLAPIYALLLALSLIFPTEQGHPLIHELMVNHSPAMMAAAALTAVVAAPLFEETAFRLVLQGWLERRQMLAAQGRPGGGRRASGNAVEAAPNPISTSVGLADDSRVTIDPGWRPIVISGVLFGLAHTGQGLSPAPLVLLGIMLGYMYQRTHRIVPCIVCHMLFNAYTILMLIVEFSSR